MTVENVEVYVCMNVDCRSRGAEAMLAAVNAQLDEQGMKHVVTEKIMCFAACNLGPNIVIPSTRCWLSGVTKEDAGAVVNYLKGEEDISRFQQNNDPEIDTMIFEMIDAGLLDKDCAN